ncbi:MAG: hypothetical protein WC453_00300 [Patescibacteria group bacterium]
MLRLRWRQRSFLFKLRLFLGLLIILLAAFFLYLKILPGGRITYEKSWPAGLRSGKGFISGFQPAERFDDSQFLRIVADPVYFYLFTPRAFNQATVTVTYRDRLGPDAPLVEIGVLQDKLTERYELQPLQNRVVDDLRFRWLRLEDSADRLVLQAERHYDSATEFFRDLRAGYLRDCPGGPTACLAVYNYEPDFNYRLPDYAPLRSLTIDQPLRGPHRFYLYLKDEPWQLSLDFVDLNQDKAQDPITVQVSCGNRIIASQTIADHNPTPNDGRLEDKHLVLSGAGQPAGACLADVRISSDVVMAKIVSSSDKLAFIGRVWPVSGTGSLRLFTDASYLTASTANPASLGEIHFAGRSFALSQTDEQFVFTAGEGSKEIVVAKDDIILSNNGVFALARSSLFNPAFWKADRPWSATSSLKYLIADYAPPREEAGWKTATARLSLAGAARENGRYRFLLSIPGLQGQPGAAADLEIRDLRITLNGLTLGQKIANMFRNLWPY